jgi:hypothetical protein
MYGDTTNNYELCSDLYGDATNDSPIYRLPALTCTAILQTTTCCALLYLATLQATTCCALLCPAMLQATICGARLCPTMLQATINLPTVHSDLYGDATNDYPI